MLREKLKTMSKKKIVGLIILAIIAILLWQVSIPVIAVWIIFKKTKIKTSYKWIASIMFVLVYASVIGFVYNKQPSDKLAEKDNSQQNAVVNPVTNNNIEENKQPIEEQSPINNNAKEINLVEKIEGKAAEIEASDITVSNSDNTDLASSDTKAPYNVVVMYKDHGNTTDCFMAKNALMKTMKSIYGDEALAGKILSVKFFALPSISASLGYNEAKYVDWSKVGKEIGPSIFWNNLEKKIVEPSGFSQPSDMWGYTMNGCK